MTINALKTQRMRRVKNRIGSWGEEGFELTPQVSRYKAEVLSGKAISELPSGLFKVNKYF